MHAWKNAINQAFLSSYCRLYFHLSLNFFFIPGMASSSPYPSWKSAPSSLEGRDRKKWWNKVFLHSWRRRSRQRKRKKSTTAQPPFTPRTQEEQLRVDRGEPIPNFSPFSNQLNLPNFSPTNLGNHLQPQAPSSAQDTTPLPTFDPGPASYKPTRPLLSNVFPMYNTVQLAPQKPLEEQQRTLLEDQQRHSTAATAVEQQTQSTEINERSLDRRQRRVGAVRALPVPNVVPKRGLQRRSTEPLVRPARYQNLKPPLPVNSIPLAPHPGPRPHIYSYPTDDMLLTNEFTRLKSIQEEQSDSEIKGFDEFMLY